MSPEEIAAICKQVVSDREAEHAPLAHRFPLQLRKGRILKSAQELPETLARLDMGIATAGAGHHPACLPPGHPGAVQHLG